MLDENYIRNNLYLLDTAVNSEYDLESIYGNLSESFIREFKDNVTWWAVSLYSKLSEDFIREFQDYVDWNSISESQELSEDFIREFADRVDWELISRYQELSEDFIREFADRVDWFHLINTNEKLKLSEYFLKEYRIKGYIPVVFFNIELSFDILQTKNPKCFEIYVCENNERDFLNKKTFDDEKQLVRFLKGMFNDFSVDFKVNPVIPVQYFDSPEYEIVAYDLENINYDSLTRQF